MTCVLRWFRAQQFIDPFQKTAVFEDHLIRFFQMDDVTAILQFNKLQIRHVHTPEGLIKHRADVVLITIDHQTGHSQLAHLCHQQWAGLGKFIHCLQYSATKAVNLPQVVAQYDIGNVGRIGKGTAIVIR